MRSIKQAPIATSVKGQFIVVPGGWRAFVFRVTPEEAALEAYGAVLGTREAAVEMANEIFAAGFIKGLRSSIAHQARRYVETYPHLRQIDGTLRGFDPEALQRFYLPRSHAGAAGSMDGVLREMAHNVP